MSSRIVRSTRLVVTGTGRPACSVSGVRRPAVMSISMLHMTLFHVARFHLSLVHLSLFHMTSILGGMHLERSTRVHYTPFSHVSFAVFHLSLMVFPLQAVSLQPFPFRHESWILILDHPGRTFRVVLLSFSRLVHARVHVRKWRTTHLHRSGRRGVWKRLRLAVGPGYRAACHAGLFSCLLRSRHGRAALRICLRCAVPLYLGG